MAAEGGSDQFIDIVKLSPPAKFPAAFPQDLKVAPSLKRRRSGGDTWVVSVFVIIHVGVFIATMLVNDCWTNSNGDCALKTLGRFSFQPLSENPLLGPSQSKLEEMGALRRNFVTEYHQTWRLFTSPFLHAGLFHLLLNLCSIIFIGIHLERELGPLRIGVIYAMSAFGGALMASLFLQHTPAVASSGALYGLLGTLLSELIWNWELQTKRVSAIVSFVFVFVCNFILGFLPYVDNFASIGGFVSGFLLGSVLLLSRNLELPKVPIKGTLFDYGVKSYIKLKLKQNVDRPVLRIVSFILFSLILAGCLVAVLHGININSYCTWCPYVDCIPYTSWHCQNGETSCKTMVSDDQMTLTCMGNGNFRVFPFTNISRTRISDLCNLIC
ncbi:RHOMBOID-like protein 8 [Arachis stenosperma]|uniref:RHOMBOID-like protein 8 n=1 Tax=Arachis stenosperma TaxID=217475 RepID=UPI0025AC11BB|nr:RHOMBOID-like protein 8 [Arachis stenosperma]